MSGSGWQPIETLPLEWPAEWLGVVFWSERYGFEMERREANDDYAIRASWVLFTHWQPVAPERPIVAER